MTTPKTPGQSVQFTPGPQITTGLVAECEADPGMSPYYSDACADAVAELNDCTHCGKSGLVYRGFKGYGQFRAIAVCPHCGNEIDF